VDEFHLVVDSGHLLTGKTQKVYTFHCVLENLVHSKATVLHVMGLIDIYEQSLDPDIGLKSA
jgi:hypothetical protein